MKKNEELYSLIASLDAGEKRRFHLFTSRYLGDHTYKIIFDTAIKYHITSDEDLIERINDKSITSNLPAKKIYLLDLIIKSLTEEPEHEITQIFTLANQFHALFLKGIKQLTKTKLKQIDSLVNNNYNPFLKLFYCYLETIQTGEGVPERLITSVEIKKAAQEIINHEELIEIQERISVLKRKKARARTKEESSLLNEILNSNVLKKFESLNYIDQLIYFSIYLRIATYQDDRKNELKYSKAMLDQFEKYPILLRSHFSFYAYAFYIKVQQEIILKKWVEVEETLNKFKQYQPINFNQKKNHYFAYQITSFEYYLKSGQVERAIAEIPQALEKLTTLKAAVHNLELTKALYLIISLSYLDGKNYKLANKYLNYSMEQDLKGDRQDLSSFERIIELIIHFELGHNDILENILRSSKRSIQLNNHLYPFETTFLEFFKKLLSFEGDKKSIKSLFLKLKDDLNKLKEKEFDNSAFYIYDFNNWIDRQLKSIK